MAKATGLIFSLFNVASAQEVPFGILQYVQCILYGLTSVLLCVPFIFADSKKCQFGSSTRWLPFIMEIVRSLQKCFSNISWFEMLCNGLNIADNGYSTFQMIIDIAGAHGTISDVVCVGSPVIIIIYKKVSKQVHKKMEFSTRVETISHR